MIGLGLTTAQQVAFHSLLASSHFIRVSVRIMTLSHVYTSDISEMLHDGQVNIDNTSSSDVTRSLSLELFDPYGLTGLDTNHPTDGALYLDRMIQIYYTVISLSSTATFSVPIFTGPITKIDRNSVWLSVEAQGKEVIALTPSWRLKTYKRGAKKTAIIYDLLRNFTGETKLSIPDLGYLTSTDLSISNESKPWSVAKSLAASINYQLFYDGRGVAVMRPFPRTPIFTFSDNGSGAVVLSKPQVGYDLSNVKNTVLVIGTTTLGTKKVQIKVVRYAPSTHPLSPWNLGRNGVPRYLFEKIEDENINTWGEATTVAEDRLEKNLLETTTVSFNCAPVPHLDPGDIYRLSTPEFSMTAIVHQMTIPLLHSGTATMGYLRRATPNKQNIRRNRR